MYARQFASASSAAFLKAQQTAMKLAKLTGHPRYTSWAALAILLQVFITRVALRF